MPSLTSYYISCSTTVPHPGVHPLFCLMGTISSQQWKFVRQKDSFRTLWLRAASNNPNYMCLVTTQWFILPYYVSCTHHRKEILELWTRLFVSHCHTTRNTFPYADESYTPTIHYANLSNECSTPERMPREFCRNSKMHPSWHTIEFHFCLPGVIIVMWVVIINLYLINEWSNSWNSSVLH